MSGVIHFYASASDSHSIIVEDVDGQEALSIYFDAMDCPTDSDHGPHEEMVELMEALTRIYGVGRVDHAILEEED